MADLDPSRKGTLTTSVNHGGVKHDGVMTRWRALHIGDRMCLVALLACGLYSWGWLT